MLVTERVEYEAFFGNEGVAVRRNPINCGRRVKAPRYEIKLIIKKVIARPLRRKTNQIVEKKA
jgi:hypothetical protein